MQSDPRIEGAADLKISKALAGMIYEPTLYGVAESVVKLLDRGATPQQEAVAWLHVALTVETVSAARLLATGLSRETVEAVVAISWGRGDTYDKHVERALQNDAARFVLRARSKRDLGACRRTNGPANLICRYEETIIKTRSPEWPAPGRGDNYELDDLGDVRVDGEHPSYAPADPDPKTGRARGKCRRCGRVIVIAKTHGELVTHNCTPNGAKERPAPRPEIDEAVEIFEKRAGRKPTGGEITNLRVRIEKNDMPARTAVALELHSREEK